MLFPIRCANFSTPYAHLNGNTNVDVSILDVVRASMTVGFGGGYSSPFAPSFWPFHFLHGFSPIIFLDMGPVELLVREGYSELPKSARGYFSERLGMAFTKIAADKLLNVRWLAEVEFMERLGLLNFSSSSKERPDLVGPDSTGAWHVFEAKGRLTSRSIRGTLMKAKRQAAAVSLINGVVPRLSVGAVLHTSTTGLMLDFDDPEPTDRNGFSMQIEDNAFFRAYYGNLIDMLSAYDSSKRIIFEKEYDCLTVTSRGSMRISIGLLSAIRERPESAKEILSDMGFGSVGELTRAMSIGGDGTAVFSTIDSDIRS